MSQGVVADNWSLQEITNLFSHGLDPDPAGEIVINQDHHEYQRALSASLQTEALFDFLTDIVLRDEILVEEKFSHAWDRVDSPILSAKSLGVVRAYPFLSESEKLNGPRDRIVQRLCTTDSLRAAHQRNVQSWEQRKEVVDPLLSSTLWGGAGMCARSFVYEKGYTPHPLRKRLFINSGFMLPADDSLHKLTTFINDNRIRVSKKIYGNDALYSMYLNLPSIPIRIIQEASSPYDFINLAIELRDEFLDLRTWLKQFQNAMSEGEQSELLKYRAELDSVADHVSSRIGSGVSSRPIAMEANLSIFKMIFSGNPINSIKNQFGVRATLNKLIFGRNGRQEMAKYIQMFGETGSAVGYELQQHFASDA